MSHLIKMISVLASLNSVLYQSFVNYIYLVCRPQASHRRSSVGAVPAERKSKTKPPPAVLANSKTLDWLTGFCSLRSIYNVIITQRSLKKSLYKQ